MSKVIKCTECNNILEGEKLLASKQNGYFQDPFGTIHRGQSLNCYICGSKKIDQADIGPE